MQRRKKLVLRLLICILIPLSCFSFLVLLNTVNPMQIVFLTNIIVENKTGETIHITPIGTAGKEGEKAILPQFTASIPAIPAFKVRNFRLLDGEKIFITYDWDDINFSEIVIRGKSDEYFQLVTDPEPNENQYHPPKIKYYVIKKFNELEPIEQDVLAAIQNISGHRRILAIFIIGCVSPILLISLLVFYRKQKIKSPPVKP